MCLSWFYANLESLVVVFFVVVCVHLPAPLDSSKRRYENLGSKRILSKGPTILGSDLKMGQSETFGAGISPETSSSSKSTVCTPSGKKAYASPKLVAYGDIRQITQTLNSLMGNADGMVIGPLILKTGGF